MTKRDYFLSRLLSSTTIISNLMGKEQSYPWQPTGSLKISSAGWAALQRLCPTSYLAVSAILLKSNERKESSHERNGHGSGCKGALEY